MKIPRIKTEILNNQRAAYGKEIAKNLSQKLTQRYGKGWSDRKLFHCIRAAYTFTEDEIVYAMRKQLTWTHLRFLMFIEDELKRTFYLEMARLIKLSKSSTIYSHTMACYKTRLVRT